MIYRHPRNNRTWFIPTGLVSFAAGVLRWQCRTFGPGATYLPPRPWMRADHLYPVTGLN